MGGERRVGEARAVIVCPKCRRRVRVPALPGRTLEVRCPSGCEPFLFRCPGQRRPPKFTPDALFIALVVLGCATIFLPVMAVLLSRGALDQAGRRYQQDVEELASNLASERARLADAHGAEVASVDPGELSRTARAHYAAAYDARKAYAPQYALSPRERALLEMQALATDRTSSQQGIIRSIAIKASPRNSRVSVTRTAQGFRLDVDFQMSELTSGEEGTRTKHQTVDSLRREVTRLVSQVSDDLYQFCKDLGLRRISIGCIHRVGLTDRPGRVVRESDTVLYKAGFDLAEVTQLTHDPYLGTYSVAQHLEVEVDEFSTLTIVRQHER